MKLDRLAKVMDEGSASGAARVPKYIILSDQIVDEIEAGNLKPGERLPGEADMAARLPASLGTIQKALARLVDQGMVIRRHGTGTFVSDGRRQLIDLRHFRFLDDDHEALLPVFASVQNIYRTSPNGPWGRFLETQDACVCVERKIIVNGEFDCFSRFYVPATAYPGLIDLDHDILNNTSIRTLLKEQYGVATAEVREEIAAENMQDEICENMGLDAGTIGLVYHIRGYSYQRQPLSYQCVYIPPNCRRLDFGPNRT